MIKGFLLTTAAIFTPHLVAKVPYLQTQSMVIACGCPFIRGTWHMPKNIKGETKKYLVSDFFSIQSQSTEKRGKFSTWGTFARGFG